MLRYQSGQLLHTGPHTASGNWLQSGNLRWVHTWSYRAAAIWTMESPSVAASERPGISGPLGL